MSLIIGGEVSNTPGGTEELKKVNVFKVVSTIGGRLLFKSGSFGSYHYSGWDDAPQDLFADAIYYTYRELYLNGAPVETATVTTYMDLTHL